MKNNVIADSSSINPGSWRSRFDNISIQPYTTRYKSGDSAEDDDIRSISFPFSYNGDRIVTPVASSDLKYLLLQRFKEEIASTLNGGTWCQSRGIKSTIEAKTNVALSPTIREDSYGGKKRKFDASEKVDNMNDDDCDLVNRRHCQLPTMKQMPLTNGEAVVRSRFVVGINQCTKILERCFRNKPHPTISLTSGASGVVSDDPISTHQSRIPSLVLFSRDVRPATIFRHIAIYCHILNVPTLILPGKASTELGDILGLKSVAVAMFLPSNEKTATATAREFDETDNDIDSFVNFVIAKRPK